MEAQCKILCRHANGHAQPSSGSAARLQAVYKRLQDIDADGAPARAAAILAGVQTLASAGPFLCAGIELQFLGQSLGNDAEESLRISSAGSQISFPLQRIWLATGPLEV